MDLNLTMCALCAYTTAARHASICLGLGGLVSPIANRIAKIY